MRKIYKTRRDRRRAKLRAKIKGTKERPRLVVFRSNKHIYAQIIDDEKGETLVSASSLKIKEKMTKTKKARLVGEEIGKKAKKKGIRKIVFDRAGYKYHGRVKALAEGARAQGLIF